MKKDYACSICGKQHVKLWRPYNGTSPLICASCAEERQSPREYEECTWECVSWLGHHVSTPTGKMLPLPKWTVNEKGKIPSTDGFDPYGEYLAMTDQIIVNLCDVSENYSSGETTMVPAVPYNNDLFWGYTSVPESLCNWWEELPTR